MARSANASPCTAAGCSNKAIARSLCGKHWMRWRKHGDANHVPAVQPLPAICDAANCSRRPRVRFEGQALCGMHEQRVRRLGVCDLPDRPMPEWATCSVGGCCAVSRTAGGDLCETHYYRRRRTGTTDDRPAAGTRVAVHGYAYRHDPSHELAPASGIVYEHRRVLFDAIGYGPHPCRWCGRPVDWRAGKRTARGALVVDHVDGDKSNNDLSNLVPSCHGCNCTRGFASRWRADGVPVDPGHPWAA